MVGKPVKLTRHQRRWICRIYDSPNRLMADYTSVNLLWSLSSVYGSLNVYGFKKDFDATLDSPAGSYFNLQIQGLV